MLKDEIWPSPLQFYMLPDIEEDTSDEESEDENGVGIDRLSIVIMQIIYC